MERGARNALLILAGLGILSLAIYLPFSIQRVQSPEPDLSPSKQQKEGERPGSSGEQLPSDKRPLEPQFSDPLQKQEPDIPPPEAPQGPVMVDRLFEGLARSRLAYDVPTYMQLGETETITLTLSPSASIRELKQHLREKGAKGRIGSAQQIQTSERMQARLTGQDFDIEAISPKTQAISYKEPTDWTWDVQPNEGGDNKKLHLTVTALVRGEGETPYVREIDTYDKTITVDVTLRQQVSGFVDKHGEWFVPAILALAGAGYAWRRRQRSGGTTIPPPPGNRRQPPANGTS